MSKVEVSLEELIYLDSDEYKSVQALEEIMSEDLEICGCKKCKCGKKVNDGISDRDKLKLKYCKVLTHLDLVSKNCRKLALALIDENQTELAHKLIIRGQLHDVSKLTNPMEWNYLCDYEAYKGSEKLKEAVDTHTRFNNHHPEYCLYENGIHSMDEVSLIELYCDWFSRGEEFKKPIRQFMEETAFKKYNFDENSAVFQKLNYYNQLMTGENL